MASRIEWTQETWNPVTGCTKVSPGCEHCYAERFSERFRGVPGHPYETGFDVTLRPERLSRPLGWKKPRRVFVNSMSDLFHEDVPDEFIDRVFAVMSMAHWHTFQVLTKRAVRMRDYLASRSKNVKYWEKPAQELDYPFIRLLQFPFQNIWLGVSVEDQKRADERIPPLLETPAAVRFVSAEPLLGPIDFDSTHESDPCRSNFLSGIEGERIYDGRKCALDWVIVGGESGPGARPMRPEWVRSIRDQCQFVEVPFFFKQWGGRTPKANGNTLDGHQYQEYPVEERDRVE